MEKPFIFILTGAGISKESGLDTFRDADGIWAKYKVENVATPQGFARNPSLVHEFYNGRRAQLKEVKPNPAHVALAQLQQEWGQRLFLVTQNIDNLHEQALQDIGTQQKVWHMHGELLQSLCANCGDKKRIDFDLNLSDSCSACHKIGGIRPDVVWFGEMPYHMQEIDDALQNADIFVSIGTSGNVYPAAGFVEEAKFRGCIERIQINLEPTQVESNFTRHRRGPASEQVPLWVAEILKQYGG